MFYLQVDIKLFTDFDQVKDFKMGTNVHFNEKVQPDMLKTNFY